MNMAGFGRVVRDHRERLHLTQEELAARGGPSTTTLTKVEAGEGRIHRKTAGDFDRAFGWVPGDAWAILNGELDEPRYASAVEDRLATRIEQAEPRGVLLAEATHLQLIAELSRRLADTDQPIRTDLAWATAPVELSRTHDDEAPASAEADVDGLPADVWALAAREAALAAGIPAVTVHELRHTGLTLYGQAGATLADLMARAGHTSAETVMIYQHSSADRDRELAARMGG